MCVCVCAWARACVRVCVLGSPSILKARFIVLSTGECQYAFVVHVDLPRLLAGYAFDGRVARVDGCRFWADARSVSSVLFGAGPGLENVRVVSGLRAAVTVSW